MARRRSLPLILSDFDLYHDRVIVCSSIFLCLHWFCDQRSWAISKRKTIGTLHGFQNNFIPCAGLFIECALLRIWEKNSDERCGAQAEEYIGCTECGQGGGICYGRQRLLVINPSRQRSLFFQSLSFPFFWTLRPLPPSPPLLSPRPSSLSLEYSHSFCWRRSSF